MISNIPSISKFDTTFWEDESAPKSYNEHASMIRWFTWGRQAETVYHQSGCCPLTTHYSTESSSTLTVPAMYGLHGVTPLSGGYHELTHHVMNKSGMSPLRRTQKLKVPQMSCMCAATARKCVCIYQHIIEHICTQAALTWPSSHTTRTHCTKKK
jgi:hypothetical protein